MTDLIPLDEKPKPQEIRYEDLPHLLPQQALMLHYIIEGNNYTDSYRKAGYTSVEHAGKAAWYMITHNPLKAHLEYYGQQMAKICSPDYIVNKLNKISEMTLNEDNFDPEIAIKALAEINKMRGNYASTHTQVNHLHASIEDVRNARKEYKKEQ